MKGAMPISARQYQRRVPLVLGVNLLARPTDRASTATRQAHVLLSKVGSDIYAGQKVNRD